MRLIVRCLALPSSTAGMSRSRKGRWGSASASACLRSRWLGWRASSESFCLLLARQGVLGRASDAIEPSTEPLMDVAVSKRIRAAAIAQVGQICARRDLDRPAPREPWGQTVARLQSPEGAIVDGHHLRGGGDTRPLDSPAATSPRCDGGGHYGGSRNRRGPR